MPSVSSVTMIFCFIKLLKTLMLLFSATDYTDFTDYFTKKVRVVRGVRGYNYAVRGTQLICPCRLWLLTLIDSHDILVVLLRIIPLHGLIGNLLIIKCGIPHLLYLVFQVFGILTCECHARLTLTNQFRYTTDSCTQHRSTKTFSLDDRQRVVLVPL